MRSLRYAISLAVLLVASNARAQPADSDRLFAEATALMADEHFAEACPKLEEAQRLDPGIGTQFNLAFCYAKTGRLAAAWRNYSQVERLAIASGKKQREEATRAVLAELRPRVPHVSVRIEDPLGVTVRVDGEVVPSSELAFVPLDPGEHKVEAVAAMRQSFEATVTIQAEGERIEVVIPVLAQVETKTEIRTVTQETTNTRRTAGFVFGGVGLAGLATATVTGIMILSAKSTASDRCKPDCLTPTGEVDSEGADAVQRGESLIPINYIAWGVSAVGIGVGAFLILTSAKKPAPKAAHTRFVPIIDGRGAGALFQTAF